MTRTARVLRGVLIAGFGWGTLTHAADWWRYGWWPYRFGPAPLNGFWNALVVLDALTVALLLRRDRRAGVVAAVAVMIADVAANSYAWQVLRFDAFARAVPVQALFLCVTVGAVPLLWPGHGGGQR